MRRRMMLAALALIVASGVLAACGGGGDDAADTSESEPGLPTRSVSSGAVEVKIEPVQLDDDGARFKITLDTHSVELSADIAKEASLEVGRTAWTVGGWSGDGPGGHHREGELRFTAAGPAEGNARLTIGGLPEPVQASWDLGT